MTTATDYTSSDARRDHPLWFEAGAMRFFGTKLHHWVSTPTSVYLVHTARYSDETEPTWNVARFSADRSDEVGPGITEGFGSKERALAVARALADLELVDPSVLTERADASKRYVQCSVCNPEYARSWATFLVRAGDAELDVCARHLPAVVTPDV